MTSNTVRTLATGILFVQITRAAFICPTLFDFYPDPDDCTKFYRCFWGAAYPFHCPTGTKWNHKLLTCDFEFNVDCDGSSDVVLEHSQTQQEEVIPTQVDYDHGGDHEYGKSDHNTWENESYEHDNDEHHGEGHDNGNVLDQGDGSDDYHDADHTEGHDADHNEGHDADHNEGHDADHNEGHDADHNEGHDADHNEGHDADHNEGHDADHNEGHDADHNEGHDADHSQGHDADHSQGHEEIPGEGHDYHNEELQGKAGEKSPVHEVVPGWVYPVQETTTPQTPPGTIPSSTTPKSLIDYLYPDGVPPKNPPKDVSDKDRSDVTHDYAWYEGRDYNPDFVYDDNRRVNPDYRDYVYDYWRNGQWGDYNGGNTDQPNPSATTASSNPDDYSYEVSYFQNGYPGYRHHYEPTDWLSPAYARHNGPIGKKK